MFLTTTWRRLHEWPRRLRWPVKLWVLAVTVGLVLYPKFWLIPRWVERLRNLDSVVNPADPGLAELEARITGEVGYGAPLPSLVEATERVVNERISYAFDWQTWGVVDYLPTVEEVLREGCEDCDGRAVLAASLLRRLGFDAWLVCDLKHTWVAAREGTTEVELMSPGSGEATLAGDGTGAGTQLRCSFNGLRNLGRAMAFGIAVFPLGREVLILAALCGVSMQPRSSPLRRLVGWLLLGAGLGLARAAGGSADGLAARPGLLWAAMVAGLAGWVLLVVRAGAVRSPSGDVQSQLADDAPPG
jgi:hypothetical protein